MKDDRHVTGTFTAFDKFGNFVLTSATEFFREEERKMQMMIVPLDFVVKIFSKPADFTKTEKL
ncbi:hypothetical protein TRFO_27530 [Tritrichomonas foetus]|uniref:Sm domain-containing protein n=1 Tax=Tritrichomonas foetus TaxID=1144522 RepID=A0A1J4K5B3_9EUKA|nr:hypothetical protein TRFO_27530 [Tritrichomonas foetus]|eukprot:OHT04908.1 hypothetical protein TRFO_27530 [Tritrichomonas foetus]